MSLFGLFLCPSHLAVIKVSFLMHQNSSGFAKFRYRMKQYFIGNAKKFEFLLVRLEVNFLEPIFPMCFHDSKMHLCF